MVIPLVRITVGIGALPENIPIFQGWEKSDNWKNSMIFGGEAPVTANDILAKSYKKRPLLFGEWLVLYVNLCLLS